MADELADGEFWLPSQFLTEEDILSDFGGSTNGFNSDLGSPGESVTETESDEDEFFVELTRRLSRSSLAAPKGLKLSGSPQSTLFSVGDGSSRGSPIGPVSPPTTKDGCSKAADAASFELLNAAAEEVAKLKMRTDKQQPQQKGTGYFEPARSFLTPPARPQTSHIPQRPGFHGFFPLKPVLPHQRAFQYPQRWNNYPLGLSPVAWPPLQHPLNKQSQPHPPPVKRESAGTGVFLPKIVNPKPIESRKTKNKNDSKAKSRSQSKRDNVQPPLSETDSTEIQLPSEWTY